jgi:hypothetical protein
MTRWMINGTVQNNTVVYINAPVWYPNGFKWVFSHPKNGKEMDGVKMATSDDGHYLTFSFWDIYGVQGNECDIVITPTLNATQMKGRIESTDGNWTLDYNYTDQGYTGKCPIKVKFHNVPYYMKVYLHHKNGTLLNEFGKTFGSNGYNGVCADLLDARISLWHRAEIWNSTSAEVAVLPLLAPNGMDLDIDIRRAVKTEFADIGNFEQEQLI